MGRIEQRVLRVRSVSFPNMKTGLEAVKRKVRKKLRKTD